MKKNRSGNVVFCALVVMLLMVVLLPSIVANFNNNSYVITVTEKESVTKGNEHKYMVFGETKSGNKVFQNTDSWINGKFNSSDIQGMIKVGEKYKIKTIGYRIPFLSKYENIIECKKVTK